MALVALENDIILFNRWDRPGYIILPQTTEREKFETNGEVSDITTTESPVAPNPFGVPRAALSGHPCYFHSAPRSRAVQRGWQVDQVVVSRMRADLLGFPPCLWLQPWLLVFLQGGGPAHNQILCGLGKRPGWLASCSCSALPCAVFRALPLQPVFFSITCFSSLAAALLHLAPTSHSQPACHNGGTQWLQKGALTSGSGSSLGRMGHTSGQSCPQGGGHSGAGSLGRCQRPGGREGAGRGLEGGQPGRGVQSGPVRQGCVSNVGISGARWPLSEQHGDHRRQPCPHPLPRQLSAKAGKVGMGKVGMVPGQG